ncbi:MAG: RibD family protein [Microcoleaceae cyanobacterium]
MDNLSFSPHPKPHTTVVLAMSADGKIADRMRSPARFGSTADKAHLEHQVALVDAVLFGKGTLDAYGTTLPITSPQLLQQRQQQGKPTQPWQIVCSASGDISPKFKFFQQPVPHGLLTTAAGKQQNTAPFEQIIVAPTINDNLDWVNAFEQLTLLGIQRIAVIGGGELVSSLIQENLIDEFWLTICPLILGGSQSPTPVAGQGFLAAVAPQLQLLEVQKIEQEIFLHYRVLPK